MSGRDEMRKQRPACPLCKNDKADIWIRINPKYELFWINKINDEYAKGKSLTISAISPTFLFERLLNGNTFIYGCCDDNCQYEGKAFEDSVYKKIVNFVKMCLRTNDYITWNEWNEMRKKSLWG